MIVQLKAKIIRLIIMSGFFGATLVTLLMDITVGTSVPKIIASTCILVITGWVTFNNTIDLYQFIIQPNKSEEVKNEPGKSDSIH